MTFFPRSIRRGGYRLHDLEPGAFIEEPYGSPEEAAAIRQRFNRAIHRFTKSVAGRGRVFGTRKAGAVMRLARTA